MLPLPCTFCAALSRSESREAFVKLAENTGAASSLAISRSSELGATVAEFHKASSGSLLSLLISILLAVSGITSGSAWSPAITIAGAGLVWL